MEVNAKRAFELLNKLSFERVSCTAEETRTAEALLAEIDSFTWARSDIQREIEVFKASTGTVTAARLIVTEPYEKEYPVTASIKMTKPITVSVKFAKPTPPNSATTSSLI